METIRLDRSHAETLLRFLDRCREAERFFEVCQAPSYRRFVSNARGEPALAQAYTGLRESLNAVEAEKSERKKPRTGTGSAEKRIMSALSEYKDNRQEEEK
ncbi:MAG: hypothetical protein IJ088_13370 [Clostridia bacterium]|nr:hypothetical protein [Clostridia bacterium]